MSSSDDEIRRKAEKPSLDAEGALIAAKRLYSDVVNFDESSKAKEIDSYDDRNFLLRGWLMGVDQTPELCQTFIFKVHNGVESINIDFVRAQIEALMHLDAAGHKCPQSLSLSSGKDADARIAYLELPLKNDPCTVRKHAIRLLPYIEGELLSSVEQTRARLEHVGRYIAAVDECLMKFEHSACVRNHMWDLANFPGMRSFTRHISDDDDRARVDQVLREFDAVVSPRSASLRKSVIQCDANDHNVIVDVDGCAGDIALIDFGDMVHTWLVNEIAMGMAYIVVGCVGKESDPAAKALQLLAGYDRVLRLEDDEVAVLRTLVAARIATSVTLGAYSLSKDPSNEYLKLHAMTGKRALAYMCDVTEETFLAGIEKERKAY